MKQMIQKSDHMVGDVTEAEGLVISLPALQSARHGRFVVGTGRVVDRDRVDAVLGERPIWWFGPPDRTGLDLEENSLP